MKHLLTATLIATTLASPVRGEIASIYCANLDNPRDRTEITLDLSEKKIIQQASYGSVYTTQILVWNDALISWAQILDGGSDQFVTTFYLTRPYLVLSEFPYDNSTNNIGMVERYDYQCTRGLTGDEAALPPVSSSERVTSEVEVRREAEVSRETIMRLMSDWGSSILSSMEASPNRPSGVGVATIRLVIDTDGNLSTTQILSSTGNTNLDEQLLSWIENSAPFERAPEGIAAARYNFDLPIRLR
ncbi:energy transducer TonB family protein [Roseobacter sp. HKCCA0882]|uniref:energy transducer TonB family protein n=1 Tax=Roseobacter sp. HKCCA0882 TaxID=3120337 RepID=UPI0030EC57BC